ncbi:MAG: chemotaxis protein CheW [Bacteroidia bacterium]|jgi:purine-binding chemotaxis protein CheW|nr:chemotaxis protein CheW [Bacteroidia bacterium]
MDTSNSITPGHYTLDDVKREAAAEVQEKETNGRRIQLVVFKIGREEYALSIDKIKEIVPAPKIAHVPQMPDYFLGVVNIRGNILAIIDPEIKFGIEKTTQLQERYALVLEHETVKAGIIVNEVPDTINVYEEQIEDAAGFVQYSSLDMAAISGVVKDGTRLIMLLHLNHLVRTEADIQDKLNMQND